MPDAYDRDGLIDELKIVRKAGLHRLRQRVGDVPQLSALATATMGAGTVEDIERMLRHAFQTYAEGAQGTAIGILLGLELGRRGASPTVLRQVASERLGYYSVETFRKRPERDAIAYFAGVLLRLGEDARLSGTSNGSKVDHIMTLIADLTLAEYWELTRRTRQWFSALSS